jgi:hypothetical protein
MILIDLRRLQLFFLLVWRVCDVEGGQLVRMPIREAWRASRIVYFDKPQTNTPTDSDSEHLF